MKKAYLSIAALLATLTLAGCRSTTEGSSSSTTSSEVPPATSEEDVFAYSLSIEAPAKTTFDVGETFDFAAVGVKLTTTKNGIKDGETTLGRNDIVVKLNGQEVEGDFLFQQAGDFEFEIASKAHPEATGKLTLHAVAVFTISNSQPDKVVLEGIEEGGHHEGDAIKFTLKLLPGFYFAGAVSIVDIEGNAIAFEDDGDYHYSFTMPAKNVTITVTANLTDFVITRDKELIGDIVPEEETAEEGKDTFSAVAGTALKFKTLENIDYTFTKVLIDGEEVTKGEDDFYHFVMPTHPIKITTDKVAKDYTLTSNAGELALSTTKMYVNPETKEEVTLAHKGQTVYLEFAYEVTLVKYQVSVKNADGQALEVKQIEGTSTFTFVMVSSDVTIEIKEDDYSKYYGFYVTEKKWMTNNIYNSSNDLKEIKGNEFTQVGFEFFSNGKGLRGTSEMTWNINQDGTNGHIVAHVGQETDSFKREFYYTEHMLLTQYNEGTSATWTDAYLGTWDENTTIHSFKFDGDSKKRLFWVENEAGDIVEKLLVSDDVVYTDFNLYTDSTKTTVAKGSDITLTSSFYIALSESEGYDVVAATKSTIFALTATENTQASVTFKNEAGETITSARNGEKVTISLAWLVENEDLSFKTPKLTSTAGGSISVTKVDDLTYTFTMPKGDVNVELDIRDLGVFKNHSALGKYVGYELWSSTNKDQDLSSSSSASKFNYEILNSGEFKNGSITSEITKISEGERGTFTVGSTTWTYAKDLIVSPWRSSTNDSYVAVRLNDDETVSDVKTKVHWISYGKSWALEFYVKDTLRGGIFATNETYYCGVTFEMTGSSERIGENATYNVKMDDQTIFTIANETVTAAE